MSKEEKNTQTQVGREQYIAGGQVQGVGFRPFVYKLATSLNLTGRVGNCDEGVLIEVQGLEENLKSFSTRFKSELPPMAKLESLRWEKVNPIKNEEIFEIILTEHKGSGHSVLIGTDMAHCEDCKNEMLDPNDKRYLYPFINCTNCGPRYSITHSLPYDRETTSMSCFPLCEACAKEYSDPLDRRFHAQPTACHDCGVEIWTETARKGLVALENTLTRLANGKIVAIKGLGGFHLSCDAMNISAIKNLRKRKSRPNKALAIMVPNIEIAKKFAYINDIEQELLQSAKRPIVLCKKKENSALPTLISPDTNTIGLMLPSSPLHELLFCGSHFSKDNFEALVMTSGNMAGEPIALGNREAYEKLSTIADHFLFHNRDILVRVDDSVLFVKPENVRKIEEKNKSLIAPFISIRRARAFVPEPLDFPQLQGFTKTILALGADLKSTCTLTKSIERSDDNAKSSELTQAFVGQHIGSMENLQNQFFMQENIAHLENLLAVKPELIVTDAHPNTFMRSYADDLATKIEEKRLFEASTQSLEKALNTTANNNSDNHFPKTPNLRNSSKNEEKAQVAPEFFYKQQCTRLDLQHHAAHAYALLADNQIDEKICVLVLDGTGYGLDGSMWGGEALYLDPKKNIWERVGHFTKSLQPANDMAVKRPWYMAESFLFYSSNALCQSENFLNFLPHNAHTKKQDRMALRELISQNMGILTSSCGRLFDAVGVLLGCAPEISYEGQVPMQLEGIQDFQYNQYDIVNPIYQDSLILFDAHSIFNNTMEKLYTLKNEYKESNQEEINAKVARYFHLSLAHSLGLYASTLSKKYKTKKVGLTGGVLLNQTLLNELCKILDEENIIPVIHQNFSPSDASISLGQAYYAYLYLKQ